MKIIQKHIYPTITIILLTSLFTSCNEFGKGSDTKEGERIISWAKKYTDRDSVLPTDIIQTSDEGYIFLGNILYFEKAGSDFFLMKLDRDGNKVWQKIYYGGGMDLPSKILQTKEGGYIVAGDISRGSGEYLIWILKLDKNGDKIWDRTYGESGKNMVRDLFEDRDGGFVAIGMKYYEKNRADMVIIKIDENGKIIWERKYGDRKNTWGRSIQQTRDGGYIVAGWIYRAKKRDNWILKLDKDGSIIWEKLIDKNRGISSYLIIEDMYGGYSLAGIECINEDENQDYWISKLNNQGDIVWEKKYGGDRIERLSSFQQTDDGGYILAGTTESFGAVKEDYWIVKLDAEGNKIWDKVYGTEGSDKAKSIQQTMDGGYIIAGSSFSFPKHPLISFILGKSSLYIWILKLDENGNCNGPGCPEK